MPNPQEFYINSKLKNEKKLSEISKRLLLLSGLRLSVFLIAIIGIYLFLEQWKIALIIAIIGAGIFFYLLSKYSDLKFQKRFHKALVEINNEELEVLEGKFYNRNSGEQYIDKNHYYSEDIDLFGIGSFFQYLNRTATRQGKDKLAELLLQNNIDSTLEKQRAIKELSSIPEWRQNFSGYANLIKSEVESSVIEQWIINYQPFINSRIKHLPLIFSMASLVVFGGVFFGVLPISMLLYWLLFGLVITGRFLKSINRLSLQADKARDTIRQYSILLKQIENLNITSELLNSQKRKITNSKTKASRLFNQFSSALDTLDNRNNIIYGIFGNGYFLTDIRNAYRVEQWITQNKSNISEWFSVIAFFDAYNSLGTFSFNHPHYVYPQLKSDAIVMQIEELGHPLLNKTKRVDNNITIQSQEFFIITGANMAGKSTFLRTVALHILMANIGLPVCAKSSVYKPVKLITSMRSIDSLKDESSYFFSELTRLKFIVDKIKTEPYFIILDEILKGTNSTDKAQGSRKFVEKLVKGSATGLIATHDLSLCELENSLKEVKNYYFDADIVDGELYFDYTLKEGICQNMNASFLLEKMGIV